MAQELLIGDYGLLTAPTLGAQVTGDGSVKIPTGSWVEVTAKASTGIFSNIDVGDLYYEAQAATNAVAPATGENYMVISEVTVGFIRSWQIEFTRTSIDTTTLRDPQSTSIFGRPSLSGTIGGILVTGEAATGDADIDLALQRFMESYKIDASSTTTTVDKVEKNTDPISLIGYTLKPGANKPYIEAYYLPFMDFGTFTVGSEVGGLTEFSSPISAGLDPFSRGVKRYVITLP